MAKLPTPSKPGFNAGDSYNVKFIRIDKIVIDPEISGVFKPSEKQIDEICERIKKDGFHKEEPVTLWGKTLVDGHQRFAAAKKAGLVEIPYIEKNFENREEAIFYTFERQVVRRNLTGADILFVAEMIPENKPRNGEGRAAVLLANRLGISPATVYQARAVSKNASEEDKQDIKDGKTSIKKVYNKIKNKQPQVENSQKTMLQSIPSNNELFKRAVIFLVDSKQTPAAESLINYFLDKDEKICLYESLPKRIHNQLPRLPLLKLPGKANALPVER